MYLIEKLLTKRYKFIDDGSEEELKDFLSIYISYLQNNCPLSFSTKFFNQIPLVSFWLHNHNNLSLSLPLALSLLLEP